MRAHFIIPLCASLLLTSSPGLADTPPCDKYVQMRAGKVESLEITEASGLAASHTHPGVLWTHNDSGDGARLFALDLQGKLLATLTLDGVTARDWEDVAIAPCGKSDARECLYIGDIGNNSEARTDLSIIRVLEPLELGTAGSPASLTAEPLSITPFAYPFTDDEPLTPDAEALLVDRASGKIIIATKETTRTRLLLLEDISSPPVLLGELPIKLVTAGDMRPDGQRLVLRDYGSFYEYEVDLGAQPSTLAQEFVARRGINYEIQGEAVAYSPDGATLYTLSEGENNPISVFDCAPTVLEPEVSDMSGGGGDMSSTVGMDPAPDALDMSPPPPDMSSVEQDMIGEEEDMSSSSPEPGCATSPGRAPAAPVFWIGALALCTLGGVRRRTTRALQ